MPLWELTPDEILPVPRTTFQQAEVWERRDLQRLLRDHIEVLGEDLMVVAEEFNNWVHSDLRIDLFCIDRKANLVVIELKRDDHAGHAELQAIRYAAMAETATFAQVVEAHRAYLAHRLASDPGYAGPAGGDAEGRLLAFLGWEEADEDRFGNDVRIILASSDFSIPLTSAVLWLRRRGGIDIRCIRLVPHSLERDEGARLLVDVQQLIPLPEAADITDRIADKEERQREARVSGRDYRKFDVTACGERWAQLPKSHAALRVAKALIEGGHAQPADLAQLASEQHKGTVLISLPGMLSEAAFNEGLKEYPGGWLGYCFSKDDQLIRHEGATWAFTNQWTGAEVEVWIDALSVKYPECGISWSVSEGW